MAMRGAGGVRGPGTSSQFQGGLAAQVGDLLIVFRDAGVCVV